MINQQEAIEFALKYLKDWTQYKKAKTDANSYFYQIKKDAEEGNCEEAQTHLDEMKSVVIPDRPALNREETQLVLHGLMKAVVVETEEEDGSVHECSQLVVRDLPGWDPIDILFAVDHLVEQADFPWEFCKGETGEVCCCNDEGFDTTPMEFFDRTFGTDFQDHAFHLRLILSEARKLNNPK